MTDRFGPFLRLPREVKGKYRRSLKAAYLESGELLEILKRIRHPNLMTVYEYDDSYVYVEMIEGLVLSNRNPYCPPHHDRCYLDEGRSIDLAVIKDAMRYLHANGICHSDITSHNILVTPDGTPKLIDLMCCLPRKKAFIQRDLEMFSELEREVEEEIRRVRESGKGSEGY